MTEMRVQRDLSGRVTVIEHTWIPMPDGTRLAAKLWIPVGAESSPVPAVLEYIPYRKRDVEAPTDAVTHGYFAGFGVAGVRVDLRGSGDSEGVLEDEYLERELLDGEAVIAWIASQPWCNGKVGVIGISWGGFNGLMLAARRPPGLSGIITVCSTDDRYADDVHYMGGALLGDNLSWASVMLAFNALPPDPAIVGDAYRAMWKERLEKSGVWVEKWMRHPRRDAYWKHGSVCEEPGAITCPVLAVSGWADGYSNAVFRLVATLPECWGIVGPWSHMYPHFGKPGPAIGFLQECMRFWRHAFAMDEASYESTPKIRAYAQDVVTPAAIYEHRPGRWVACAGWPDASVQERRFRLAKGRLEAIDEVAETGSLEAARSTEEVVVDSPATVGVFGGKWCSYSVLPDQPLDQRPDDAGSAVFDSEPLGEDLVLLGAPSCELSFRCDRPVAQLAVRLCAVSPSGASLRLTYGLINLTHRDSHERPEPVPAGEVCRVRVQLNELGQHVPAGHRLRLAVSTAYFPIAWPAPRRASVALVLDGCALSLPAHRAPDGAAPVAFEPPEGAAALATVTRRSAKRTWTIHTDAGSGVVSVEIESDGGATVLPHADELMLDRVTQERYTIHPDDPASATAEVRTRQMIARGAWTAVVTTETKLRADAEQFFVEAEVVATENGETLHRNRVHHAIDRDLV